jgi:hypothetical protein
VDLREVGWGGMDWLDLARDRDQWKAFVNTAVNLGFHKMSRNSSVSEWLAASE